MTEEPRDEHTASDDSGHSSTSEASVASVAREALGELGLEHRLLRTLQALLTKPGFLTSEYRSGRGAAYISPVRLYLVSSAAYYASSFAGDTEGFDLGFMSLTGLNGQLPGHIDPYLILIAGVPVFALLLAGLFGSGSLMAEGKKRSSWAVLGRYGEFLVFALYFQSLLLWIYPLLRFVPLLEGVRTELGLIIFVSYIALAARRLWSSHLVVGVLKAFFTLVLYAFSLLLAGFAAIFIEGLLGLESIEVAAAMRQFIIVVA